MHYFEVRKFDSSPLDDTIYSMGKFIELVTYSINVPAILIIPAFKDKTKKFEDLVSYIKAGKMKEAEEKKYEVLRLYLSIAYNIFPTDTGVCDKIASILGSININKLLNEDPETLRENFREKGAETSSLIVSEYLRYKRVDNILVDSSYDALNSGNKRKIRRLFKRKKSLLVIMQEYKGKGHSSVIDSDVSAVITALTLNTDLTFSFHNYKRLPGNPKQISFWRFYQLESQKEKRLISKKAMRVLMDNEKSFRIVNFDNTNEEILVHF